MSAIVGIAFGMLWLVALYLIATNGSEVGSVVRGVGETWFAGIKVLQGR